MKHEARGPRPPPYLTDVRTATFDIDDRLDTFNGQNVGNDADGNMTSAAVGAGQWKTFSFFDARNGLTSVDSRASGSLKDRRRMRHRCVDRNGGGR